MYSEELHAALNPEQPMEPTTDDEQALADLGVSMQRAPGYL